RLALDQSNALARETENLARLPQRQRLPVLQPVPERHAVPLALVEHAIDGRPDLLAEQGVLDLVERGVRVDLLDQVAELGVLAHGRLQRQRLPAAPLRPGVRS